MRKVILIVAGLAVLVGLFLLVRPRADAPPAGGSAAAGSPGDAVATGDAVEIEAEVEDGQIRLEVEGEPITAPGPVRVNAGHPVALKVETDVPDQVHVHGYDIAEDLRPGEPATLRFVAALPGVWEVELHRSDLLLLRLEVAL